MNFEEIVAASCPVDSEWLEFAQGRAAGRRQDAMQRHLDSGCATCQGQLEDARMFLTEPSALNADAEYTAFRRRFGLGAATGRTVAWQLAGIAAALVAMAGASFLAYDRRRLVAELSQQRETAALLAQEQAAPTLMASVVADLYPATALRSGPVPSGAAVLARSQAYTLLLHGPFSAAAAWDVEIIDERGRRLRQVEKVRPQEGVLPVAAGRLEPGVYTIRARAGESMREFHFELR